MRKKQILMNLFLDKVSFEMGVNIIEDRSSFVSFVENCGHGAYCCDANTKVRFNDCTMHHNGKDGLVAWEHVVVDLHGTKTDIHSNNGYGIQANHLAKVNIHLPSQHNTTHDNGQDRYQDRGGSIANVNADGTFTHVEEVDLNDGDDYW